MSNIDRSTVKRRESLRPSIDQNVVESQSILTTLQREKTYTETMKELENTLRANDEVALLMTGNPSPDGWIVYCYAKKVFVCKYT